MSDFQFKNYCWVIGTTSFRVDDLNYKNELQLNYLSQLFKENPNEKWANLQEKYYQLLTSVGFKNGNAARPDKDARELTSGLADIGLVDRNERTPTEVGDEIRNICKSENYKSDNIFGISKDSYVYLLQFLKLQVSPEAGKIIRPFVALLFMLCNLKGLSRKQFTYLLPICMTPEEVVDMTAKIKISPNDDAIDGFLVKKILSMANYQDALHYLLTAEEVNENVIADVGMNRKSAKYDRPIFGLYSSLHEFWLHKAESNEKKVPYIKDIIKSWSLINKNQGGPWGKYLSITKTKNVKTESFLEAFSSLPIFVGKTEEEFRKDFFLTWHLLKWKSTLEDYYDLNKRYFSLTDIIIYRNSEFRLTKTAEFYFSDIVGKLLFSQPKSITEYSLFLSKNLSIAEIDPCCNKTKDDIANDINKEYGAKITGNELDEYLKQQKNDRFKEFIKSTFTKEVLIKVLDAFIKRDDETIRALVSDEASPSTSFEYIAGLIWFGISGQQGNIEDCFNLTLNSNFLPIQHAGGNMPDLQFDYKSDSAHPAHTMLMEVTLADNAGQRHMEWEPVSRHLENQIIQSKNKHDYALFISSIKYAPTIKSFRAMKQYVVGADEENGTHLKIIPIDAFLLKKILQQNLKYDALYQIFEKAFQADLWNMTWFKECVEKPINQANEVE